MATVVAVAVAPPATEKRKREAQKELEVNQIVNAIVEIVKENYLVLSLPAYNFRVGYAYYNTQKLPPKQFVHGQSVSATVMAVPDQTTCGRLLLVLNDGMETSSSKRAKKNKSSSYNVGSQLLRKSDSEKNDESDAESRALVPPLEVHLDVIDVEGSKK